MDRGHSYVLGSQSESIPNATARGLRWTPTEEAVLVTKRNVPIRLLAAELGRTYFGVCQRIKILRSRGLID